MARTAPGLGLRAEPCDPRPGHQHLFATDKSPVVGAGKLKPTEGVYGLRFAHNTDAIVTGLTVTKP